MTDYQYPVPTYMSVRNLSADVWVDGSNCGIHKNEYTCEKRAEMYMNAMLDENRDGKITTFEAQNWLKKYSYGHHKHFDDIYIGRPATLVLEAVRRNFFANSPFDGKHSTVKPLEIPAGEVNYSDGDTFSAHINKVVNNFIEGTEKVLNIKISFRLPGDTAESFLGMPRKAKKEEEGWAANPKLESFEDAIWLYGVIHYGLTKEEEKIRAEQEIKADPDYYKGYLPRLLIRNRIVFTGKIGGVVAKGVKAFCEERDLPITVTPNFDRTSLDPAQCNVMILSDSYGRGLVASQAGRYVDSDKDVLYEFIRDELPKIMGSKTDEENKLYGEGMASYNYYHHEESPPKRKWKTKLGWNTVEGAAMLEKWKNDPKKEAFWRMLSPETLPNPSIIFSKENCARLAEAWKAFTDKHPGYKNDIHTMMIFIGVEYAYPKYRSQHTPAHMEAEAEAMGPLHMSRVSEESRGLWGEVIFQLMQPNPTYSALFREFPELARGQDLLPPDCCDVLERTGQDIYDHCPAQR